MSADETDGSKKKWPPRFRIVMAEWQSQAFRNFLWLLDTLYREDWEDPVHRRAMGGNIPRVRVLPPQGEEKAEVGVPPIGLPRNCYDSKWVASLSPHVRAELEIKEEDYDFSIP